MKLIKTTGIVFTLSLLAPSAHAETTDTLRSINLSNVDVISSPREIGTMRQQPHAVSLLDNQTLKNNHVTSIKGVASMVPNLFIPDYGSRMSSAIFIRGIGSRINAPAVGMYVDNIPYADKSGFDFNLFDIERIDVLRGPQGTLYGRNTMGGLMKIHTRNPFLHQGTTLNLGYASSDNHGNISLSHYQRINQRLAYSAGAYYEGSDGFFRNDYTGGKVDRMQAGGLKLRTLFLPSDRLKFDFNIGYDYTDEGAYPYYYTGSTTGDNTYDALIGKLTANREGNYRRGMFNTGLNIEYKANAFLMSAVTGFQNLNDRMMMDQDFISADIYTIMQKQHINTITEEITFKSRKRGFWEWVSGASFMYQWLKTEAPVTFYSDGVNWLNSTINGYMPVITIRGTETPMSVTLKDDELTMGGTFHTPTLNLALFHQSTFHLTHHLAATLGLRIDYDHKSLDYDAPATIRYDFAMGKMGGLTDRILTPYLAGTTSDNYLRVLPKVSLKYDFDKDRNVFLSVAKGMRSGGYNVSLFSDLLQSSMKNMMMTDIKEGTAQTIDASPYIPDATKTVIKSYLEYIPTGSDPDVASTVAYKPEFTWNYELGTHLGNTAGMLQVDASLYYMHTRDQQVVRFSQSGLGRIMANAGKSESYGAEASVRWNPIRPLVLMANYGYTHATFKDYSTGNGEDYSGNRVPFVPQHTVGADISYTWPLHGWTKSLSIGANYNGAGDIYWTEANDAQQSFYSTLGLRVSLDTRIVEILLWAKNITDAEYNTFYFVSASRGYEQHGKPRQIGFDLKFHF